MFEKVMPKKAQQNLAILAKSSLLKDFYLAGGTGLAMQLNHRLSIDFDFFTTKTFRPEILAKSLSKKGKFILKSKAAGTLHGFFNQTKVSFLAYPYPLLYPRHKVGKINLAHYLDIACMKLDALATRGSKKDFIDLYFICQKTKLEKLFKIFAKKYQSVNFNLIHLFKSLVYFAEAEKQPMPKMLENISWLKVKEYFIKQIKLIKKDIFKSI